MAVTVVHQCSIFRFVDTVIALQAMQSNQKMSYLTNSYKKTINQLRRTCWTHGGRSAFVRHYISSSFLVLHLIDHRVDCRVGRSSCLPIPIPVQFQRDHEVNNCCDGHKTDPHYWHATLRKTLESHELLVSASLFQVIRRPRYTVWTKDCGFVGRP